jgi:DNA modification methylase
LSHQPTQLPLFNLASYEEASDRRPTIELGTFKDSMRAPIHSWFQYPAGYSYKFVEHVFDEYSIKPNNWVYDPFCGSGTTLVVAKKRGINAYGVEAHSFVHWVASVKLYWEYDFSSFSKTIDNFLHKCKEYMEDKNRRQIDLSGVFPELIYKCYHLSDLRELYLARQFILTEVADANIQSFLKLALTDTLRKASAAGTGWPYIAPNKNTGDKPPKNAFKLFATSTKKMYADIMQIMVNSSANAIIQNVLGDSRHQQSLSDNQIDIALTSPPYLNNYDYADRTRLETYFWGITKTWSDITAMFREKLIVAATTQVIRRNYEVETALSQEIKGLDEEIYKVIQDSVLRLAALRKTKGGKKDYDLMVALYFNDMLPILQESYRVIRNDGKFIVVVGDSAPYGVHIPTEDLIGRLGLAVGFRKFDYKEFRSRGGKWKDNPQRHTVPLREGVVIFTK